MVSSIKSKIFVKVHQIVKLFNWEIAQILSLAKEKFSKELFCRLQNVIGNT